MSTLLPPSPPPNVHSPRRTRSYSLRSKVPEVPLEIPPAKILKKEKRYKVDGKEVQVYQPVIAVESLEIKNGKLMLPLSLTNKDKKKQVAVPGPFIPTSTTSSSARRNAERRCRRPPIRVDGESDFSTKESSPIPPNWNHRGIRRNVKRPVSKKTRRSKRLKAPKEIEEPFRCSGCSEAYLSKSEVELHEESCIRLLSAQGDIRDNDPDGIKMKAFMKQLGLIPIADLEKMKSEAGSSAACNVELALGKTGRRKRTVVQRQAAYYGTHPLPISSLRGIKFLRETGEGIVKDPSKLAREVEKDCGQHYTKGRTRVTRTQYPTKISKNMTFKPDQYVHTYTFSKQERLERNTELVLGLKAHHFSLLNKCKAFTIPVKTLTIEEAVRLIRQSKLNSSESVPPPQSKLVVKNTSQEKVSSAQSKLVLKKSSPKKIPPPESKYILKKCSVKMENLQDSDIGRVLLYKFTQELKGAFRSK